MTQLPSPTQSAATTQSGPAPFPTTRTHGDVVYTSGIAALDPTTMTVTHVDFEGQVREVFGRLESALAQAESGMDRVLSLHAYLAHRENYQEWNRAFAAAFPTAAPVRTTLVVGLPVDGLLVEITAIATATATNKEKS